MRNGILILNKPQGFTSHDAVAKLRGILRQKKIGHAGTLDPMATGVLVMLLGSATRASDHAAGQSKEYQARLRLGLVTDTQDITGTVLSSSPADFTPEQVLQALDHFTGTILQTPPMYSAVQVGGRRLYDLARRGIEIERDSRPITISQLELLPPAAEEQAGDFNLRVVCSKGAYIRTLCHDVGQQLGCGGCMAGLTRTRSGRFTLEEALTFDQIEALRDSGGLDAKIYPPDAVFSDLPAVTLNPAGDVRASHGAFFVPAQLAADSPFPNEGECCRVYDSKGAFNQIGQVRPLDRGGLAIFCKTTFWSKDGET